MASNHGICINAAFKTNVQRMQILELSGLMVSSTINQIRGDDGSSLHE